MWDRDNIEAPWITRAERWGREDPEPWDDDEGDEYDAEEELSL